MFCRFCSSRICAVDPPPRRCPECGSAGWEWSSETREDLLARLRLGVRDILKSNRVAGIGRTTTGQVVAVLPILFDRWLALPEVHGELLGVVDCLDHIDAMLPDDESATRCRRPQAAAPKRSAKMVRHEKNARIFAECVHLRRQGLQHTEIARHMRCGLTTVKRALNAARAAGEPLPRRIDKKSVLLT